MINNQEKIEYIEVGLYIKKIIEIVVKNIKTFIISIIYIFKTIQKK